MCLGVCNFLMICGQPAARRQLMVGEVKQRVSIDADSENSVNNETTRTTTNYVVAKCAIQI